MAKEDVGKICSPLREGREFWALAVELLRQSSLTMAAFCRREGLSEKALGRWKRKLSLPAKPAGSSAVFVPVRVAEEITEHPLRPELHGRPDDQPSMFYHDRGCGLPRPGPSESTGSFPAVVELHICLAHGRSIQARVPAQAGALRCVFEALEGRS